MKRMVWTREVPLTIGPTAHPIPQPLSNVQPFLELVDALSHGKEPFIRFSHFRERVQERVGEVIDQPVVLFWARRVGDMLVHMHMLRDVSEEGRHKVKIGVPIRRIQRTPSEVCSVVVWDVATAVVGTDGA